MKPEIARKLSRDSEILLHTYSADVLNAQSILDNTEALRRLGRTQRNLLTHLLQEFIKDREFDILKLKDDIAFYTTITKQEEED